MQPGHYIRRLQQIAVGLFVDECDAFGVTPVQFAAMQAIQDQPSIDQRSLASSIGLDTSTIAGVIDRLDARGLVQRSASKQDKRVRLLSLTVPGQKLLKQVVPAMLKAQQRILAPLPTKEQEQFMKMLVKLVDGNNGASRAPRRVQ